MEISEDPQEGHYYCLAEYEEDEADREQQDVKLIGEEEFAVYTTTNLSSLLIELYFLCFLVLIRVALPEILF